MTEYHFFVAIKVYIIKSSLFIRNVIEIFLKVAMVTPKLRLLVHHYVYSACVKFEDIVTNIFQVNNFIRFLRVFLKIICASKG